MTIEKGLIGQEGLMKLSEQRYHADRGDSPESYQSIDITVEAGENLRGYLKFGLMEHRWRSKAEAADYLRWAANEIESLP